ncbi:Tfb4-domain-containing protein [Pholiota conissans]|uniref:General transcription and DNA repair factor IIH subunit TFB4 n=1 Tax=Pholiota conissans TaxID=109636 RepID=A0A9P5Z8H6_9AGAR|nr:Tfb4-domain-containing protein [Pholiota conissans]
MLSVSPDLSTSYIPIMNAIFSAQKLKITIDACQIFGPDTVFLQQAAHLTGGSYLFLERHDALLQYLIMAFLPPPAIRKVLAVPTQDKVDFRAACFCHKNIVDIGFVCSVCLSIFCQPVPVCSTCRTKFPIKTLKRLNAARPPAPSQRPSPAGTPVSRPAAHPADKHGVTAPHVTNGSRH